MTGRRESPKMRESVDWHAIGDRYAPYTQQIGDMCATFNEKSGIWKVSYYFRSTAVGGKDIPNLFGGTTPYFANRDDASRQLAGFAAEIAGVLSDGIPTRVKPDDRRSSPTNRWFKYYPIDFSGFITK